MKVDSNELCFVIVTLLRVLIFCVHTACVAEFVAKANNEVFIHRDIAVRLMSSYMQLAFKATTPKAIQEINDVLSLNDVKGPNLQHQICHAIEIGEII